MGGDSGPAFGVGRPVVLVDINISRSDLLDAAAVGVNDSNALLFDVLFNDTFVGRHRLERTGNALGILNKEEREPGAVRRPTWVLHVASDVGELFGLAAGHVEDPELRVL